MGKLTLQGLWSRKRRLAGTFLAVFIGVAFLSGTLALGDTLRTNFNTLFSDVTRGTDAVVRSTTNLRADRALPERAPVAAALVAGVRDAAGVADAEPYVQGYGAIIAKDGTAIGGNGPPRLAASWLADPALNPYRLAEGRAPQTAGEVVINRGAAKKGGFHIGDTVIVQTPEPVPLKLVGIATFGSADGFGSATYAAFTLETAEQRLLPPGRVSSILVKAAPGVSQSEVVQRIRPALPAGDEVVTGAQLTKENTSAVNQVFLNLLRTFLVVFAAIALLVATFSIYNTFSIIAAQRTREAALLRAVGATRRQVLASVVVEALVVGVAASLAGLFGGVAVAGLLKAMFDAFGFALPTGGLVFKTSTVVISLAVGLTVTVLAGVGPAVKASRVRPLAALRDVAAEDTAVTVARVVGGLVVTSTGVAVVLASVLGGGSGMLGRAGLGALLTITGFVILGPVVAARASGVLAAPVARLRGVTGALARRNAMRNPRRTSGTAAALMVGVAVATLFTVFAGSLKASLNQSINTSFGGDLVVGGARFGGAAISTKLADAVDRLPEVRNAVGLGEGAALVQGSATQVTVADPVRLADLVDLGSTQGSVGRLGAGQVAVSRTKADAKGWRLGQRLAVTFPDGANGQLSIGAVYKQRDIVRDVVVPRAGWAAHATQDVDRTVLIGLKNGVGLEAGRAAVQRVTSTYGGPAVEDRKEYMASVSTGVNTMLGLVYVLLALAIVIALMGIANTLSLSIHERTRELGLLRAVGQTRGQLRSMVRWESVVLSSFGAAGGLAIGLFLGWALVRAAASSATIGTFAVPAGQLVVVVVLGALSGVVAGYRPARRAAKLNILAAIASE
jgi:putative ABC transport system permease protein